MPSPNAMWLFGLRVMSKRLRGRAELGRVAVGGADQTERLLALLERLRRADVLAERESVIAMRPVICTGGSKRSSSSTAPCASDGSAQQLAYWSGWRQQLQHAVADQVHRRLVAGDQQEAERRQQFLVA